MAATGIFRNRRHREPVMGQVVPPPRPTVWAFVLGFLYLALPLLVVLSLADILLYLLFENLFGMCYGIACFWQ